MALFPFSHGSAGQANQALNNQLNAAAQQNQYQQAMNQQAGIAGMNYPPPPTWNDHVPVWDEGGWELWLGKPMHRVEFCQRCMFL